MVPLPVRTVTTPAVTATAVDTDAITKPGVYTLAEDTYHADPVPSGSLSFSGAKRMLPPHCPALYKHDRDNGGRPNKRTFDFGHAAHGLILGAGRPLVVVDADDWRGKAAREARDAAYAAGDVPILASEHKQAQGMAEAILRHPKASALLTPGSGKPEQSLFRRDKQTGVTLRSRLDWLPNYTGSGLLTVPDYKTAISAYPQAFSRSAASYGYHMQAAWYSDMVTALGLADEVRFLFIVQEKTAPYLVSVVEFDDEALAIGRRLNREAIDVYADCVKRDRWPGYSKDTELIALPTWATYEHDMDVS